MLTDSASVLAQALEEQPLVHLLTTVHDLLDEASEPFDTHPVKRLELILQDTDDPLSDISRIPHLKHLLDLVDVGLSMNNLVEALIT